MKEIDSIKHKKDTRTHIPSIEEAGFESANPKVKDKAVTDYPVNLIVHRGQDPELFWMNKYGRDDREDSLKIDIRSLYRHEHISPEVLIQNFYNLKETGDIQGDLFNINELFGNALEIEEIEKVSEYYKHQDGWSNRLIQGDSLLVMTSLLEREGMAGKVQAIYIDPPYGIKYGSNWQMHLHGRDVKDGSDDHLTGEPEQIKAYRDTWELGIHSYLSYLRDRLSIARELLTESGSCFVQISDENVHLVRCLMDEVFGSENFCLIVTFSKTVGQSTNLLPAVCDYILWYSKNKERVKFRKLFQEKLIGGAGATGFTLLENPDGTSFRSLTKQEITQPELIPKGWKVFDAQPIVSQGWINKLGYEFEFNNEIFQPPSNRHWTTTKEGMEKLNSKNRLVKAGKTLQLKKYLEDFPVTELGNIWIGLGERGFTGEKLYVVQTASRVIERCLLMTTDPGDLILDPTCGSGTTAYIAEQWGRRWITIDTSRIALNIAKTRLMTATFPYYKMYDEKGKDIRQGFIYKKVPHITLKSLANDEPAEEETLYDQPETDNKKLRVAGPFTVETLQSFEPIAPEAVDSINSDDLQNFEERIFEHLKSAGIKTGVKEEAAVFTRIERLASGFLHAEGFYNTKAGEKKAYIHIGPRFGTVSRQAVNEAIKECRLRGDSGWLIILGFSFESNINNESVTTSMGSFEVTKNRMADDLLQEGLLKKDKKAASFVTIGEPDIKLHKNKKEIQVEICGLDIYDPIKDEVKPRNVADIAYWMVDDNYDGSNFIVKQVFFCGGDKDEFDKWRKGLDDMAKRGTKKKAEQTLKLEIDDEAFDRVYGHLSHPIEAKKGQKIAVKVVSQFGEESMKVIEV